jgi:hypothetical protein
MKQRFTRILAPVIIALAMLGVFFVGMASDRSAMAAPPLAPTPVANILDTDQANPFYFQTLTGVTADTNTEAIEVLVFDSLDIQHVIDHNTVNTTTLTVQYSNDNSNWVNGVALVTDSAADGTDITRVPVFGRYMRINQNVTSSNYISITLLAVGR